MTEPQNIIRHADLHERLALLLGDYVRKRQMDFVFADLRTAEQHRSYLLIERRRKLARHLLRKIQAGRPRRIASNVIEFRPFKIQAGPL